MIIRPALMRVLCVSTADWVKTGVCALNCETYGDGESVKAIRPKAKVPNTSISDSEGGLGRQTPLPSLPLINRRFPMALGIHEV